MIQNIRKVFQPILHMILPRHTMEPSKSGKMNTLSLNRDFIADASSEEAVLSIFQGEWASQIPGYQGGGKAALFDDSRIKWLEKQCEGFSGKSILELGPMEGGHTYMLWKAGAASVVSIEGNKRSYLKCLITKELLGYSAKFKLGDFSKYLATTTERYDFILASGVLYHMAEPITLLENISRATDRIGMWTHYFDENVIVNNKYLKRRFDIPGEPVNWRGKTITAYRQKYRKEPGRDGFVGGNAPFSCWLRKEDILNVLESLGFSVVIGEDNKDHKNGPEILLYAQR